ncbi:MAG TPA: DHH family phosphoesterase [Nitrososphaeraceae archaeon]|nr:DHH family phosphoesterase [Nitrososphaeraceae archaeon]
MTNTKRILSLTHEQDVDGLFSSAILKNAFPDTLVFLTNYGHKNMQRAATIIKFNVSRSRKNGTIVITDLGIDDIEDIKPIEDAAVDARNYGWDFVWLDHHVWSEEIKNRVQSFASLILSKDEMKCTAELVHETFAKNRRTCEKIAKFAHIVDFRLSEVHKLPPLPELISYYRSLTNPYPKLQSIVNKASKGIFWDDDLQEDFEHLYLPIRESAISSAIKSLTICDIHNHKVAITESPRILSKSILSEKIFLEKPEVSLVILFAPDGKVSIRRKPGSDIKCDVIGRRLDGGGHSYAAAGIIRNSNESLKIGQVSQAIEAILKDL